MNGQDMNINIPEDEGGNTVITAGNKQTRRFQRGVNAFMIRLFLIVWITVSLVALIPFLRPSVSSTEKRKLKEFPQFSFSALFSGSYFDDIGLWYSDTFPLRDNLMDVNARVSSLFGVGGIEVYGDVVEANTVPDGNGSSATESGKPEGETADSSDEAPVQSEPEPDVQIEKVGAVAVIGNAGYEYYNFDKSAADTYSAAINRAAAKLSGKSRVFCTVVPTSISVILDEKTKAKISSSDQEAAINYIYSNINSGAAAVDTYGALMKHRDEYIYFRTDHHWTATGAYYSYQKLIAAAGKKAAKLTDFKEYVIEGFLGTLYASSGKSPRLGDTPDTVYAYEPIGVELIHTYDKGYEKDLHIVASNAAKLNAADKYMTFIGGDHPLGVITNEGITDDSSCLVIKESFGNAMVAYFTQNYHKVYVVDYRYIRSVYSGTLDSFVQEYGINDVFFVNNISATRESARMKELSAFVGE